MDTQFLHHLLGLVAQTGDRLIVVDPTTNQPFVLMDLPHYTELIGRPTERREEAASEVATHPSVATVNEDIAAWRATAGAQPVPPTSPPDVRTLHAAASPMVFSSPIGEPSTTYSAEPLQSATVDDDRFYVEPLE